MILLVMLGSCEERADWSLQKSENNFIVVDGMITNELKYQTIILTKPVANLNEKPKPVTGATLLVSSDQQVHNFHEDPANSGIYVSDEKFTGIRNRSYSLLVTSGNQVYSAKATLEPPVALSELGSIQYAKNPGDDNYHISKIPTNYNPNKYGMYEIQLDWSSVPGYESGNSDSCKAKVFYYTLPTIDVSEVFAPGLEKVTFPSGTVLTQRRYSLTAEHAAFIRAMLLETTWSGGYFNTASANVPTNMSEGAKGFFGACGITEKVEVVK